MKNMLSLGLKYENKTLLVLDQRLLPAEERWVRCDSVEQMVELIRGLAVRGAPLIGVAAALSLGQLAEQGAELDSIREAAKKLRTARPTAVNLMAAVDRLVLERDPKTLNAAAIASGAEEIFDEDVVLCDSMARHGSELVKQGEGILTHCNTGGLATAGIGTALGVIRRAHEQGKKIHVYVDETRPLLQGARLTAWELEKLGIPYTLICDNMAAFLMSQGKVQRVFVGADRIARNGDTANKVGTYSVAIAAKHHDVPFYIVAPHTTWDESCPSGREIPIEERGADEVRAGKSPASAPVWNPAFDVTPRSLITGIVTDQGIR